MNRSIKFRAWDKKRKIMFEPSSISWKDGVLWVCDAHGDNKLEYELINPNSELMQFTGLKDKNGKEIYEGDIVKIYVAEDWDMLENKLKSYWDHEPKIIEVKYEIEKSGYGFDGEELFGMEYVYPLGADDFVLEIIGNICQNPYLLIK